MNKQKTKHSASESAFLKNIGANIRRIRQQQDISQEYLANMSETERSYMGLIERGDANPTILKLKKISEVLDINVMKLFDK